MLGIAAELPVLHATLHPDVGDDQGGLQPRQGLAQQEILSAAGLAADGPQHVMGMEMQGARQLVDAALAHVVQRRGNPDQDVGVSDRRHAEA